MHHNENQPRARRRTVVLAVTAGIAFLTAACGGGGTSAGSGASPAASTNNGQEQALAYSQCMRSHGVPKFPDPSNHGDLAVNTNALGVSTSVLQAGEKACASLKPGSQSGPITSQDLAEDLKFAECMRSHGEPDFPDPSSNGSFKISPSSGISPQSSTFQKADQACRSAGPSKGSINISGSGGGAP
jgi:hypothetical protein